MEAAITASTCASLAASLREKLGSAAGRSRSAQAQRSAVTAIAARRAPSHTPGRWKVIPGPPFSPKQSLWGNSMAEAWRSRRLASVNSSLPARTHGAGERGAPAQIPDRAAAATGRSIGALLDGLRLREDAFQDVIADGVVLLVERGVGDARHHRELLVGVGQPLEELYEVGKARDAIVFAAHDEGRHRDLRGIADRQIGAHVDIRAGRHRVVELEDGVGKRLDDDVVGGAGMVALEDRAHEFAVNRTPVLGAELA